MNISYTYRPTYLLAFGIEFIILWIPVFILIMIGICNNFLISVATKDKIFFIVNLIGVSIITSYGVYNIIQGTNQFEIQFSDANFKAYKNFKLKIDEPVETIENVNITHGKVFFLIYGGFEYFKIEIKLKEMDKFQLVIRSKKWILKFLEFIKLLEEYCSEKQIEIIKSIKGIN